ncbi:MAG: DUF3995 domain-containing protein [Acidimicrobiales bacterium]
MSIRLRTECARRDAGFVAATALAGASTLHALWAPGSSWPAGTPDELADLVVGGRPMPDRAACGIVAASLALAAGATACSSSGAAGRVTDTCRGLAALVSAALVARGVGGIAADVGNFGDVSPSFRRWNRRLYNPLCTALGVLVAIGRQRRP